MAIQPQYGLQAQDRHQPSYVRRVRQPEPPHPAPDGRTVVIVDWELASCLIKKKSVGVVYIVIVLLEACLYIWACCCMIPGYTSFEWALWLLVLCHTWMPRLQIIEGMLWYILWEWMVYWTWSKYAVNTLEETHLAESHEKNRRWRKEPIEAWIVTNRNNKQIYSANWYMQRYRLPFDQPIQDLTISIQVLPPGGP